MEELPTSFQVFVIGSYIKTPELAVKAPDEFLLPEKVHTILPSLSTAIAAGCPSVRGGLGSLVQVDAARLFRLLVM